MTGGGWVDNVVICCRACIPGRISKGILRGLNVSGCIYDGIRVSHGLVVYMRGRESGSPLERNETV